MAKGIIEHVPWLIQACDQGCPSIASGLSKYRVRVAQVSCQGCSSMGLKLYNLEAMIAQPVNDGRMFSPC